MVDQSDQAAGGEMPIENQAREQTGQREIQVRVDERNVDTNYANAFRASGTAEEVILDFGLNRVNPTAQAQGRPEIIFQISERVTMNYYSAKRLAITLGQLVRRYEDQFGTLELDAMKRRKTGA